jgi:acetyltransferase
LTHIDPDWEIALAALDRSGKMLGICCVAILEDRIRAEFAVLIGDPWQGKGIGAELLEHSFHLAEKRGIKRITGRVLLGNVHMLELGRKLGFTIERVPGASEYELSLDLNQS